MSWENQNTKIYNNDVDTSAATSDYKGQSSSSLLPNSYNSSQNASQYNASDFAHSTNALNQHSFGNNMPFIVPDRSKYAYNDPNNIAQNMNSSQQSYEPQHHQQKPNASYNGYYYQQHHQHQYSADYYQNHQYMSDFIPGYSQYPPPPPAPEEPPPPPPPPQETTVFKSSVIFGSDISKRPKRLCILLRGLPGSGKSTIAKQIRDIEKARWVSIRIFSIDDYFLSDDDFLKESDSITAVTLAKMSDTKSLALYSASLEKALRRAIDDVKFDVLLVDACHVKLSSYESLWSVARRGGYEVMVAQLNLDVDTCLQRLISGGQLNAAKTETAREILRGLADQWEDPAPHMPLLDLRFLLGGGETRDIEMEEEDDVVTTRGTNSTHFEDEEEDQTMCDTSILSMDNAEEKEEYVTCDSSITQEPGYENGFSGRLKRFSDGALDAEVRGHVQLSGCLKRSRQETSSATLSPSTLSPDSHKYDFNARKRKVHWGDFKVIEIDNTETNEVISNTNENMNSADGGQDSVFHRMGKTMWRKSRKEEEGAYVRFERKLTGDQDDWDEDAGNDEMSVGTDSGVLSTVTAASRIRGFEISGATSMSLLSAAAQDRWRPGQDQQAGEERSWKPSGRFVRHGPDRDRQPMFKSSQGEPGSTSNALFR
mmetsp:Transcript_20190/g.20290  ORF Transcript_20190/g.20290 Transcript_20190/m.20290 type:complete len:653 (-) Transcript_20190:219-2177(-)